MSQVSGVVVKTAHDSIGELSDAHCHLELFADPELAVKDANSGGVGIIITAGGTPEGNLGAMAVSKYDGVFGVIGIDPSSVSRQGGVEDIKDIISRNRKIIGIGEIGLDSKFLRDYGLKQQKQLFAEQIEIAKGIGVPVVVHCRGMMDEAIKVIEEYRDVRFMMHFFDGTLEQAELLSRMGNLISIPTAITSNRKKVIKHLGIDNIVVETDSPVVGRSPSDVKGTIELISKMKNISFYDVASMITKNLKRFFYI